MRRFISILLFISLSTLGTAYAQPARSSAEQERIYLVQLLNQLNAMPPLILAAEKAQPKNLRISFHYTAWRDSQGQRHNGLLEDVQAIKKGIEEKLNTVALEPRSVQPIRGDYIDQERQ